MSESGKPRTIHDIKSLGHSDRRLAERQAKALAAKVAEARLTGVTPDSITLGQVFDRYRRERLPALREKYRRHAVTRMSLFEQAWGRGARVSDIGQSQIDRYSALRRAGELSPFDPEGAENRKGKKPRKVRDGTLAGDFRWLSSVLNFARRFNVNGRRLLRENPLHDVRWPKEKNPRQPVASHQRCTKTLEHTDEIDPRGRLRCVLTLARYTGRRQGAIAALRASDVLLSTEAIRTKLAAVGMDERIADSMPDGAIHWSAETDKVGLLHVTPISGSMRAELDRYLRAHPRIGEAPLFPSDEADGTPLRTDVSARWLLDAEAAAELPKLEQGVWHPYRRLWASERKHLPPERRCRSRRQLEGHCGTQEELSARGPGHDPGGCAARSVEELRGRGRDLFLSSQGRLNLPAVDTLVQLCPDPSPVRVPRGNPYHTRVGSVGGPRLVSDL